MTLMFFNLPRKHLLRCMEAQQEEERILKKAAHQFNQPYLDVAIIIEGPTTSLKVGGTGTTSVSLLQEEDDELSNPKKDVKDPEADNEEISVTVKPNSKKQVTQSENLELKVSHNVINSHYFEVNVSELSIEIEK